MLPNKPRGVRPVNDRRVLNGIFWVLRSGAPWRDPLVAFHRGGAKNDSLLSFPKARGRGRSFADGAT
jgi:transposase